MTTEPVEDTEFTPEDSAPDAPKKKLNLGNKKIKILVLLVLVMGIEGAALFFFLPNVSTGASGTAEEEQIESQEELDSIEVEIGKFVVTNDTAAPTVSIHLKFTVTAVVSKKREFEFDDKVSKDHRAWVRQTIESVWRGATMDALNDSDLTVIKRKIREQVNKNLKQDYIRRVLISDFTKTTI